MKKIIGQLQHLVHFPKYSKKVETTELQCMNLINYNINLSKQVLHLFILLL